MEELLLVLLKAGPEYLGWAIAIAAIIMHFRSTQRTIDMAERNTETQNEMSAAQLERALKDSQTNATLEKLLTILNERLPRKEA